MLKPVKNYLVPNNNIHVIPALPRQRNAEYNRKFYRCNGLLYGMEANRINIVSNNDILERDSYLFVQDGVHFSRSGTIAVVRIIKTHLNQHWVSLPMRNIDQKVSVMIGEGGQRCLQETVTETETVPETEVRLGKIWM